MLEALNQTNVLVLIPAFNEEKSIGNVLDDLIRLGYQILVIDDGSTDNTSTIVNLKKVPVCQLPYNQGVGAALRCGFKYAVNQKYSAVVQVDADGQHPIRAVDQLIQRANQSTAQMIIGSRFLASETTMQVPAVRRFVMKVMSITVSNVCGTRITDTTSGFRLIRNPLLSEFAKNFPSNYLGDTFEALIAAGRAGYEVAEIPAPIAERKHGESSANVYEASKLTIKVLLLAYFRLHFRVCRFPK